MRPEDEVKFWIRSSDEDYVAMEGLFAGGHYAWCLFVGHLAVEKLLKAIYIKQIGHDYPRIHNLGILARKVGLEIDEVHKKHLDIITRYNIEARYHNEKQSFYQKANRIFAKKGIEIIKETREWLLENL